MKYCVQGMFIKIQCKRLRMYKRLVSIFDYSGAAPKYSKIFFDTYNIPYQVITRSINAGKLRVKQPRSYDSSKVLEIRRLLTEQGYGTLCDHSNVFRNEDDRTVVTFSPYHDISPDVAGEIFLPGYDVEISDLSIYGYGTKTVVIRAM